MGSREAHGSVEAAVTYIDKMIGKPSILMSDAMPGDEPGTARHTGHKVIIHDARRIPGGAELDRHGFVLCPRETAAASFDDEETLRSVYYPECERLVREMTGASRALVFDHNVRSGDAATRTHKRIQGPVALVHNDYTAASAPRRLRALLPASEADRLLAHRLAIFNLWRPIQPVVRSDPLAVCDAASIAPGDLVATDLRYRHRTGEEFHGTFNPAHRWYYYPNMRGCEALLIKCHDSATDGRARFTLHTAFKDPTSPPDAPARESIEVRCFAFFAPST
jgi:hypothetical protein